MQLSRLALFPPLLALLGLTGCHRSQPQMLPLLGSAHPTYTITDLGAGLPSNINNNGQVVGEYAAGVFPNSHDFPYLHGCLWSQGKRTEMPTLGGWYSNAVSIMDDGRVIGTATVPAKEPPRDTASERRVEHQCLWDGHRLTDLDAEPRFRGTSAIHITKAGGVYAASPPQGRKERFHLWFYPAGFGPGVRHDIGVIGGPEIKPMFINDNGMVVGTWDAAGVQRGFVWHTGDGKWRDLGSLGGFHLEPKGLNDVGQVVGQVSLPDDPRTHRPRTHAFLWQKGRSEDLGTLPDSYLSCAGAINNRGQVVGFCQVEGNGLDFRPLLWDHGHIKDLSRLIPAGTQWGSLGGAAGINDKGQIVGDGSPADPKEHYAHGYLLTPCLNPQGS